MIFPSNIRKWNKFPFRAKESCFELSKGDDTCMNGSSSASYLFHNQFVYFKFLPWFPISQNNSIVFQEISLVPGVSFVMLFFFECVEHRKVLITGSYLKYHWLISNIKYISGGLCEEEKIIWKSGRNRGESFCVWRVLWRYRVTNFPYITQRFFVLNHGLWIEDTVVCF